MGGGMENYRSQTLVSMDGNGSTIAGEVVASTPKATTFGAALGSTGAADPAATPSVPTMVPSASEMQRLIRELEPETAEDANQQGKPSPLFLCR
jgi:hypothetical protein